MRALLTAAALLVAAVAGGGGAALAQQPQPTSSFSLPFTISVTPRVWYVTDNENLPSNFESINIPGNPLTGIVQTTRSQVTYPLGGLTLEATPKNWPNVSFLLTGFYGRGDQTGQVLTVIPVPTSLASG